MPRYTCTECGTRDFVYADGVVTWIPEGQYWVLLTDPDNPKNKRCGACGCRKLKEEEYK